MPMLVSALMHRGCCNGSPEAETKDDVLVFCSLQHVCHGFIKV
jgi:hypothetical protein